MAPDIHPDAINSLLSGDHGAPFDLLGPHDSDSSTLAIRAFRPTAQRLYVVNEGTQEEYRRQDSKIKDKQGT